MRFWLLDTTHGPLAFIVVADGGEYFDRDESECLYRGCYLFSGFFDEEVESPWGQ